MLAAEQAWGGQGQWLCLGSLAASHCSLSPPILTPGEAAPAPPTDPCLLPFSSTQEPGVLFRHVQLGLQPAAHTLPPQ